MFESAPKKKRVNSDQDIDGRLATYLEILHSTQSTWFKEGTFENVNSRMRTISQALDETRKILDLDHEWGDRERRASSVSLALSEEYNYLSTLKEGFAQKKEIEKQKELPKFGMQGAGNPYVVEGAAKKKMNMRDVYKMRHGDSHDVSGYQVSYHEDPTPDKNHNYRGEYSATYPSGETKKYPHDWHSYSAGSLNDHEKHHAADAMMKDINDHHKKQAAWDYMS